MPVGIDEWRAGIAFCRYGFLTRVSVNFPGGNFLSSVYCPAYLYVFIWLSVLTLPLSVLVTSSLSFLSDVFGTNLVALQDPILIFINITLYTQVTACFAISHSLCSFRDFITISQKCPVFCKRVVGQAQRITHFAFVMTYLACVSFEDVFSLNFLLLLAGDIETNPGPQGPFPLHSQFANRMRSFA